MELLRKLSVDLVQVARDKRGSFVVQKLVDRLRNPSKLDELSAIIGPKVCELSTHSSGHFVVSLVLFFALVHLI
jgi:hypothetical protein